MFTRDRLPEYFIKGQEPRFHPMAPIEFNDDEVLLDWRTNNPEDNPSHWHRQWYVFAEHGDDPVLMLPSADDDYHEASQFLLAPWPVGYSVRMWFTLYQDKDWSKLWYYRAVAWHNINKMSEGAWWCAAKWIRYGSANEYFLLFEKENDAVLAGAFLAGMHCDY